ncbi:MAG: FlgD immunoglobulin-like domain containing protein [candidate division WOR-3 bacterium]
MSRLPLAILVFPAWSGAVVTFERTWCWRVPGNACGYTVEQTADGGYIVGGHVQTGDSLHCTYNMILLRTDSLGDTLWKALYQDWRMGYECLMADGGCIIVGDTFDNDNGHVVVAAKVDSTGKELWRNKFFISASVSTGAAASTADGGVIVTGIFEDACGTHLGLEKVDSRGELSWFRTYPVPGEEASVGKSVVQTSDGGYIVSGLLRDTTDTLYMYLVKTDSLGETLWTKVRNRWNRYQFADGMSIRQTDDGGYIITGSTQDTAQQDGGPMLMKTDYLGEIQWLRVCGGNGIWAHCVRQTWDKGYVIAGPGGPRRAACLIRTDSLGDTLWTRSFRPPFTLGTVSAFWVEQTADRGYVLTGDVDYWYVYLVKTDSLGMVEVGLAEEPGSAPATRGIQVSPNPCVGKANIVVLGRETESFSLEVHDAAGRLVRTLTATCQSNGIRMAVWDCTDGAGRPVPTGVYLVRAANRRQASTEARLVLVR